MSDDIQNGAPASGLEQGGFKAIESQEELDRVISGRIQREKAKFADYDELKSRVQGFDSQLATARNEGKSEAESGFTDRIFQAEVKAAAVAAGFHDPNDAVSAFGSRDGILSGLDVDAGKLSARLSEIAEQKPYLVKAADKPKIGLKPKLEPGTEKKNDSSGSKGSRAAAALRDFSSRR